MAFVVLQILPAECLRAFVDAPLLRAHKEKVLAVPAEVEAETAGEAGEGGFVLLAPGLRTREELELHDLFAFELVLHHQPVRHPAVRRDREEVQGPTGLICVPAHLPNRISVFVRPHGALIDRLLHLRPDVVHKHGAVVEADGEDGGVLRMPVQRAHAGIGVEDVLGEAGVLERVAADHAGAAPQEVVGAETDSAKIVVLRVPLDASDLLPLRLFGREAPQWKQRALAVAELIALVFPILEVQVHLVLDVLVHHPLHDLDGQPHALGINRRIGVLLRFLLRLVVDGRLGFVLVVLLLFLCKVNVLLVRIEDVPLRDCAREARRGRRLGGPAPLTKDAVLRLYSSIAEVELISQWVLHGHFLFVFGRVEGLLLILVRPVALGLLLLLVLDFGLLQCLPALLQQNGAVDRQMEDGLVDLLILPEGALLVRVLCKVVGRLRVLRVQDARRDLLLQFLRAELHLVLGFHLDDHWHVEILHRVLLARIAARRRSAGCIFGRRRGRTARGALRGHRARPRSRLPRISLMGRVSAKMA
mmetsp:Transcript_1390/g.2919  ORF Transcript_1390/g.2919 Transcript_1390/m.2919 type:complete len:531 (-) Transcript_1390:3-1595(-)